ncbi:MAG: PD40 domain-containing protein [Armatimonadetes bacterium]|nr:PD40 domain-containing protein [Armatimonadota bacterium]
MDVDTTTKLFHNASPNGSLIAYSYGDDETPPDQAGLYVMNPDGSNPRRVCYLYPQGISAAWLPGNQTMAYVGSESVPNASDNRDFLYTVNIDTGQRIGSYRLDPTPSCDTDLHPELPPEQTACAQRCNAGQPCILEERPPYPHSSGHYFFFPDGRNILFQGDQYHNFFSFNLDTLAAEQLLFFGEGVVSPSPDDFELAPDGTAITSALSNTRLAVMNVEGTLLWELQEPLMPGAPESDHHSPTWSRDSQKIAFVRNTVFPPDVPEDQPWEVTISAVQNQIWIVNRNGTQVQKVADLWVDGSGQVINLAANLPKEKRYYAARKKVIRLARKPPARGHTVASSGKRPSGPEQPKLSPRVLAASEHQDPRPFLLWGSLLLGGGLAWYGIRHYRNRNHGDS